MKWFNINYVKQKPFLFIGIILVFGVFFVFYLNRNAGGSGSTVITSGKSDAQIAAEASLAQAQLMAGIEQNRISAQLAAINAQGDIQLALAGLQAQLESKKIDVESTLGAAALQAQLVALNLQYQQSVNNNQFQLDYAKQSFDAALAQTKVAAGIMALGQLTSAIGSLKKKNRDEAYNNLLIYMNQSAGGNLTANQLDLTTGGGGFFGGLFGAINPVGLIGSAV